MSAQEKCVCSIRRCADVKMRDEIDLHIIQVHIICGALLLKPVKGKSVINDYALIQRYYIVHKSHTK